MISIGSGTIQVPFYFKNNLYVCLCYVANTKLAGYLTVDSADFATL